MVEVCVGDNCESVGLAFEEKIVDQLERKIEDWLEGRDFLSGKFNDASSPCPLEEEVGKKGEEHCDELDLEERQRFGMVSFKAEETLLESFWEEEWPDFESKSVVESPVYAEETGECWEETLGVSEVIVTFGLDLDFLFFFSKALRRADLPFLREGRGGDGLWAETISSKPCKAEEEAIREDSSMFY